MTAPSVDIDLNLLERGMVTAGWQTVDLLNCAGEGVSAKAARNWWDADWQHATDAVDPLGSSVMPPRRARAYESRTNMTRFARTLEFVRPGDRVYDIGLGHGYLPGVLLRDGQLESYRGVDLVPANVRHTQEVIDNLGAGDRASAAVGDLYATTRDELTSRGTTLAICCEVIEHVPDPEQALAVLAEALPDGAELLFSVPLLTRLEGVWGHVAFFDTHRVQAMVAAAGLTAHVVEAVANTWAFILASRDPSASTRGLQAVAASSTGFAPPSMEVPTRTRSIDLATIAAEPSTRVASMDENVIAADDAGLTCRMTARPGDKAATGGLRLPVSDAAGFRFEVEPDPVEFMHWIRVDAYADDELVARWRWRPEKRPAQTARTTAVLRAGRRGTKFVAERLRDVRTATWVEVVVELDPGASARLTITRAALME